MPELDTQDRAELRKNQLAIEVGDDSAVAHPAD